MAAVELCHKTNSLPEVADGFARKIACVVCTLNDGFGAVTIGSVEKYITDRIRSRLAPDMADVEWTDGVLQSSVLVRQAAAADILARGGVKPVVFDRHPEIGGLLTFGIRIQAREISHESSS